MRFTRAFLLIPALAFLFSSTIPAFGDTAFSVGSFSSTYATGELHVQFTLIDGYGIYAWGGAHWATDPVLVEVVRIKISGPCSDEVNVTFLPWQPVSPHVTADIADAAVEPNTTYQYIVYGIDGQGARIGIAFLGSASTGAGLLCHGTLSFLPDCGVSGVSRVIACDGSCASGIFIKSGPPEISPYWNTTTTLAIYGEVDGLSGDLCNVIEPAFKITSVVEQPCVSAVEPVTWGAVKAMYR
jgi:hypothetical protein